MRTRLIIEESQQDMASRPVLLEQLRQLQQSRHVGGSTGTRTQPRKFAKAVEMRRDDNDLLAGQFKRRRGAGQECEYITPRQSLPGLLRMQRHVLTERQLIPWSVKIIAGQIGVGPHIVMMMRIAFLAVDEDHRART